MHNDEQPGASRPPSPAPDQKRGTLAAFWGQPGQLSFSKEKEKAPQRKRRKKEDGPPQGRLVFGAEGMSVATPPAPPAPEDGEDKKGRKRKTEAAGDVAVTKPGRKRGWAPNNVQPNAHPANAPGISARAHVELSPDSIHAVSDSDPDPEVIFTGGTPPASQVRQRGTGQAHDPVEVDDTPRAAPTRKNIVFVSDSKPAHSFFDLRPSTSASAASEMSDTGSGAATPATGTATATASGTATPKVRNGGPLKAKVHSFFGNGGRQELGALKYGWGNCREGDELDAPLPRGEWPNHLGMPEGECGPSVTPKLHRRERPRPAEGDARDGFFQDVLTRARSPTPPSSAPSPPAISAPPFILEHPAISAALSDSRPDDRRETWCERHRPREAGAVLGNELEAKYLRDWLEALTIGLAESRKVIRRVPRRKMANPDLAWIVDDIGLFGEPADEFGNEEPPEPYEEPYLGPGERPNSYPALGAFVGNTIVLNGPSGTGKSAAVHAVATELGWDVFEVYPGIGKRTGPHLVNLVGDVSKNHTVGSHDKKNAAAAAAMAMFAKANAKPKPGTLGSQGSVNDPIELEEDTSPATGASAETSSATTKQSLILIDEADILFDEASTFWPTIVSLIAESRRPVVITCNDLASVPTDILPLQVILHFRAAPSYLAQPYLATIARKHGFSCNVPQLFQDCSRPCLPDLVQQPLPPNGNEPEERFDLRAALMQMQLDRQSSSEGRRHRGVDDSSLGDIGTLARRLDAESYTDAFVAPRPWARLEISEGDRFMPTGDDQDGIKLVCKPDVQDLYAVLAGYSAAEDMAAALLECAGGGMRRNPRQLQYDQSSYIRGLLPFLDPLTPLSARLLPHPSLFLDVVPIVRSMVLADDAFDMADRAAVANGEARINPRTGRAMRTQGYERWLNLSLEGRTAAVESGLVFADV